MTIQFNCPKCNSVIGFADKHAGKRAHCTTCGQSFVIPASDNGKVKAIKPPKEVTAVPIPGFYRAVFIDNWKIFLNPKNITGFALIIIAAVFKFLTAGLNFVMTFRSQFGDSIRIPVPLGWTCTAAAWGLLFWYYREIIYITGFDQEDFPEVKLGGFYSFLWKIIESVYTLFVIVFAACLPAAVIYFIFEKTGIENTVLLYVLVSLGFFLLPAAVMNVAAGKDITLLRTDYLIREVVRDFIPYCVIFILLSAAIFMEVFAELYNSKALSGMWTFLLFNFAAQAVFVFAIRAIGLFYRHYSCHCPW